MKEHGIKACTLIGKSMQCIIEMLNKNIEKTFLNQQRIRIRTNQEFQTML